MKWYHELILGFGIGLLILAVLYRVFATEPNVRVIEYRCIEETCKVEFDSLRVQFHELDAEDTLLMLRQNHYRLTGKYVVFRRVD